MQVDLNRLCFLQEEATPRETLEAFYANGAKSSASRWLPKWRHGIAIVSGEAMRKKKETLIDYI
jgi:hypothetical protein